MTIHLARRRPFRLGFLSAAILLASPGALFGQLRIVTYNTLDKPITATDASQLRTIFGAIATTERNGIAKRPDIIALQEQEVTINNQTAVTIAAELNALYGVNTYVAEQEGVGGDVLAYVYDSATVTLESEFIFSTAGPRPVQRGQFSLVGYDSSPENDLYLYNSHLSASSASTRASEANTTRNNANALGPDANVIYLGDLNIGSSGESTYNTYLAPGNAQAFDPIQLPSFPSFATAEHLTQSTRTSSLADGGVGGGLDDRFDFQLVTDDLLDGEGLTYLGPSSVGLGDLEDSYQAFGNDGVSFNSNINNTFVGRSQPADVLNALFNFSDHLPVVADYQLPALLAVEEQFDPETPLQVVQGDSIDLSFLITNAAPVVAAVGADELDYVLSTSGDLSGGGSGAVLATTAGDSVAVTLDTATLGSQSGLVTVTTSSQGAPVDTLQFQIDFEVIAGATPGDFNDDGLVTLADFASLRDSSADAPAGFAAFAANFNAAASPSAAASTAVPEPATLMMFCITVLGLGRRSRC